MGIMKKPKRHNHEAIVHRRRLLEGCGIAVFSFAVVLMLSWLVSTLAMELQP